jgi:hypothetical protein
MKIGIVCYPTFGGSGVVATELGKALADRGIKFTLLPTTSRPGSIFFQKTFFTTRYRYRNTLYLITRLMNWLWPAVWLMW